MKIFSLDVEREHAPPVVLVFGSGMIGGSVQDELSRTGYRTISVDFSWDSRRARHDAVRTITSTVEDCLRARCGRCPTGNRYSNIEIVWAAGKAGFRATEEVMNSEIQVFEDTMDSLILPLAERTTTTFRIFSSAGGVYEGSGLVGPTTETCPLRPYGEAKLKVEQAAKDRAASFHAVGIYRPSTVYGPVRPGSRVGLINRVIENTLAGRTTPFFARPDTLRDYVYSRDIARYVCGLPDRSAGLRTEILASGKPTSLNEVKATCETVLGRPALVSYSADVTNGSNITFARRTLPAGFVATDLDQGVRATARAIAGASFRRGPCRQPPWVAEGVRT